MLYAAGYQPSISYNGMHRSCSSYAQHHNALTMVQRLAANSKATLPGWHQTNLCAGAGPSCKYNIHTLMLRKKRINPMYT
jgi:hypothetical protein